MNETDIIQLITSVGPYGALAAVSYFMRPIWAALASRITHNGNGVEGRLNKIETNDLKHIEEDVRRLQRSIVDLNKTCALFGERLARIEGRLNHNQ